MSTQNGRPPDYHYTAKYQQAFEKVFHNSPQASSRHYENPGSSQRNRDCETTIASSLTHALFFPEVKTDHHGESIHLSNALTIIAVGQNFNLVGVHLVGDLAQLA